METSLNDYPDETLMTFCSRTSVICCNKGFLAEFKKKHFMFLLTLSISIDTSPIKT